MCSVEKLLIKGIRSFSPENDHAIVFPKPLTLIVGRNGAGKTVRISSRERLLEMRGRERGAQNFPFAFAEVPASLGVSCQTRRSRLSSRSGHLRA